MTQLCAPEWGIRHNVIHQATAPIYMQHKEIIDLVKVINQRLNPT